MTLANLRAQTSKDLAQIARERGVAGWHSMRKEQLVQAIMKVVRQRKQSPSRKPPKNSSPNRKSPASIRSAAASQSRGGNRPSKNGTASRNGEVKRLSDNRRNGKADKHKSANNGNGHSTSATRSLVAAKIQREQERRERLKNLALSSANQSAGHRVIKDRVILIVRDAHWLQVYWEITELTVKRAKTALEKQWRGSRPVLRLFEINNDEEKVVREIDIHSGVDTWYIDIKESPTTFRVAIGYVAPNDRFYMIAKSNKITTPARECNLSQDHWADIACNYETYFALSGGFDEENDTRDLQEVFERKLRRPMRPVTGNPGNPMDGKSEFPFAVDAQMVVYGFAAPGASVSIAGEPLQMDREGNFSIRMDLPDKRQVLPVVACSRDGAHQRTTVLAIERNTKVMDPVTIEIDES